MVSLNRGDRIRVNGTVYHVVQSQSSDSKFYIILAMDEQTEERHTLSEVPFDDVELLSRTSYLTIKMSDNRIWAIPTTYIARDRAKHYADEFEDSITQSMEEDTLPLFDSDDYEVRDWASNNMNWKDVEPMALVVGLEIDSDYQADWIRNEKSVKCAEDVLESGGGVFL